MLPGADAFAEEPRAAAFADGHEAEIRVRLGKIGVVAEKVECRATQCQLVVSGVGERFDEGLAAMEDERGFYGWAKEMMVGGLVREGDKRRVTVTLVF